MTEKLTREERLAVQMIRAARRSGASDQEICGALGAVLRAIVETPNWREKLQ